MINHAFASYSTRVSFNLTLTKTQVFYLWQIAERNFVSVHSGEVKPGCPEMPRYDIFVPSVRGLIERGLVVHHVMPEFDVGVWPYELTDAGKHVYELLKLAGLVQVAAPKQKAA